MGQFDCWLLAGGIGASTLGGGQSCTWQEGERVGGQVRSEVPPWGRIQFRQGVGGRLREIGAGGRRQCRGSRNRSKGLLGERCVSFWDSIDLSPQSIFVPKCPALASLCAL